MSIKSEYKNYGLKFSETPDVNAYVLGGLIELPKIVLRPDGDWSNFLPVYEPQFNKQFDSYGCTVWGSQNCLEIYLKQQTGVEYNFSERFTYILAGIRPPGADPHEVIESMRKYKVIPDKLLPFTDSYEEFLTPNPMTEQLLAEGRKWSYGLGHQYVWNIPQTKEQRLNKIKEYLRYSPLGVSVTAWILENGVYVDNGQPNTHWCVLYGITDNGYLIFDSYDHGHKVLSFDHQIQVAKRFYLEKKTIKRFWLWELLRRLFR